MEDILGIALSAIKTGRLRYSAHANQRMHLRKIIKPEVEFILKYGHHESRKDQFNAEHESWDYSISGKTLDGRKLRVVVAYEEPHVLVITTIDLDKED